LDKVVLSRKEIHTLKDFNFIVVLQRLLNSYPSAFSYCFYHPNVGLWLGAFSEQLLKMEGASFYTSAVAGTQVFEEKKSVIWQGKEQQEQEFVSDFIVNKIKKIASQIKISAPYTIKAGNLLHIKTDIQGILNSDANLKQIVEILHPTPAVCGLPLDKAKDFILNHEGYDREYYSGFLGELNADFSNQKNATDLYVNLRCVKLDVVSQSEKIDAHLFVGGGITKDSIPEKEWNETVNKSQTIKKILDLAF
jgi:isochorismate synthase